MVEFYIQEEPEDIDPKDGYRVMMYHPEKAPKGKIHVIPSAKDKPALFKERGDEGWVEVPTRFPKTVQDMTEEAVEKKIEADLNGASEVLIEADLRESITKLLSGIKVKDPVSGKEIKGFSLTALCRWKRADHNNQVQSNCYYFRSE
jgi:hypothetical protein